MSLDTNQQQKHSPAAAAPVREQRSGHAKTRTTFALPIPGDRLEAVRAFVAELLGPRRQEFERSWQAKGITAETAWLQSTPQGALVLVSMEAEDLGRAFAELASSDTPFDRWYRQRVLELYGVDLRQRGALNDVLADWHAP